MTAVLALGSLALASLLSVVTWQAATGYMLTQRQDGAFRQADANANVVRVLRSLDEQAVAGLLSQVRTATTSSAFVRSDGVWSASSPEVRPDDLPPALLALAEQGRPARQRLEVDGVPRLAVAVPLDVPGDVYVQVFSLVWLDSVFRVLGGILLAGTVAVAVLGGVLARWASGRVLLPVTRLASAAQAVSAGDLATRLDADDDRDLAPLARSFNAMTASLQRRTARDARFASDVSHELRTPLTTMLNSAAVLRRRRDDLPDRARTALDLLSSDLDRFARLVTDLLEISKVDQDAHALDLEPVDLRELTATAARAAQLPDALLQLPARPAVVLGDRRRLERVLANLLDNARLHGGGATCVSVQADRGRVEVVVDDAGPGVPAAHRERVFERFARVRERLRPMDDTGSGLGLALAAEHVRLHEGTLRVEDSPAGGARFVLSLPGRPS